MSLITLGNGAQPAAPAGLRPVSAHAGCSRAPPTLRLSQPAVSKAVAGLERQTWLPLLERGPADACGSPQRARPLRACAGAVRRRAFSAEEEIGALRGLVAGLSGRREHDGGDLSSSPACLARSAGHPGVGCGCRAPTPAPSPVLLLQRRLDLALVEGPVEHPQHRGGTLARGRTGGDRAADTPLGLAAGEAPADVGPAGRAVDLREPGSGTRASGRTALAERQLRRACADSSAAPKRSSRPSLPGLGWRSSRALRWRIR